MSDLKYCPMTKEPCKTTKCAWWIEIEGRKFNYETCAIPEIACNLHDITINAR